MTLAEITVFEIASRSDVAALRETYAREGRIQVRDLLSGGGADAAYTAIAEGTPWRTIYNDGNKTIEVDAAEMARMDPAGRAALTKTIFTGAARGFQYCFDNFPLFETVQAGGALSPPHRALHDLLASPDFIKLMRAVTGDDGIDFADMMLSRYRPGHFLTTHDDRMDGLNRRHAYVLNFTPNWQADWGGLLMFRDAAGNISGAYTPAFNVLNIFRVPREHAVSLVAPFAPVPRFAVTGWLRSR